MRTKCMGRASGTGYRIVESSASCVLTRFRVNSVWALVRFYRSFRRIRKESHQLGGLLASFFFVENLRTCYTLSLWRDGHAILDFNGSVNSHITAANASFKDLRMTSDGPEIWSAQFRLWAISPHNLRWAELELDVVTHDEMAPVPDSAVSGLSAD